MKMGDKMERTNENMNEVKMAVPLRGAVSVAQLAIDLKEAATVLAVSPQTIMREINRGNLRALKIGRQWRVRVSELDAYLERQERKARIA